MILFATLCSFLSCCFSWSVDTPFSWKQLISGLSFSFVISYFLQRFSFWSHFIFLPQRRYTYYWRNSQTKPTQRCVDGRIDYHVLWQVFLAWFLILPDSPWMSWRRTNVNSQKIWYEDRDVMWFDVMFPSCLQIKRAQLERLRNKFSFIFRKNKTEKNENVIPPLWSVCIGKNRCPWPWVLRTSQPLCCAVYSMVLYSTTIWLHVRTRQPSSLWTKRWQTDGVTAVIFASSRILL